MIPHVQVEVTMPALAPALRPRAGAVGAFPQSDAPRAPARARSLACARTYAPLGVRGRLPSMPTDVDEATGNRHDAAGP